MCCVWARQLHSAGCVVPSLPAGTDSISMRELQGVHVMLTANPPVACRYPFEPKFLRDVSTRICNKVRNVNRVVYDITSKPPGTIEWE